ncbi:uncharacterized protein ACOB7L_007639 [Callospermophilus lateralis]
MEDLRLCSIPKSRILSFELILLLSTREEVLWEPIHPVRTTCQGRLLRPILQGKGGRNQNTTASALTGQDRPGGATAPYLPTCLPPPPPPLPLPPMPQTCLPQLPLPPTQLPPRSPPTSCRPRTAACSCGTPLPAAANAQPATASVSSATAATGRPAATAAPPAATFASPPATGTTLRPMLPPQPRVPLPPPLLQPPPPRQLHLQLLSPLRLQPPPPPHLSAPRIPPLPRLPKSRLQRPQPLFLPPPRPACCYLCLASLHWNYRPTCRQCCPLNLACPRRRSTGSRACRCCRRHRISTCSCCLLPAFSCRCPTCQRPASRCCLGCQGPASRGLSPASRHLCCSACCRHRLLSLRLPSPPLCLLPEPLLRSCKVGVSLHVPGIA